MNIQNPSIWDVPASIITLVMLIGAIGCVICGLMAIWPRKGN